MSDKALTPELLLGAYAAGVFPMAETAGRPRGPSGSIRIHERRVCLWIGFHLSRSAGPADAERGDVRATIGCQTFRRCYRRLCGRGTETWINRNDSRALMVANFMARAMRIPSRFWRDERSDRRHVRVGDWRGLLWRKHVFRRKTDGSKMALAWAVDHLKRSVRFLAVRHPVHHAASGQARGGRRSFPAPPIARVSVASSGPATADIRKFPAGVQTLTPSCSGSPRRRKRG